MIMPLLAPAAGHLRPQLLGGAIMKAGDLIARLDLDDFAATSKALPFTGAFPDLGPPIVFSSGVDVKFSNALNAANMIMAGGALPDGCVGCWMAGSAECCRLLCGLLQPAGLRIMLSAAEASSSL